MSIAPGTRLGGYEIVSPLGAGGMGEVYRARDGKLGRDVALKLLPARLQADDEALKRFQREARAVAALNHPNIVTIYGVDDADGRSFLAMELVDGQTLRELIPGNGLSLDDVMKFTIPLADALAAAHEEGIAHRDLKPANVMVTRQGRVKVLDFGLAKLRHDAGHSDDTRTKDLTGAGRVVGTVAYMSPEQAAGKDVDARTDLFSLGVLLYEMATGQRPFTGEHDGEIMASILRDTPRTVTELRPELPRDFSRIVRRALAKDPEDRYQTAKDLRNDLRTLKADLTSGELSAADEPAVASGKSAGGRLGFVTAAVALVAAAAVGYALWGRPSADPSAFSALTQSRLTSTGRALDAAISRDGRYVAHAVEDEGFSLWARQISTGAETRLVPPEPAQFFGIAIDPGGDYVYYSRARAPGSHRLERVPLLGGQPERIAGDVDWVVTFSPDGSRLAYLVVTGSGEARVMTTAPDGSEPPEILVATPALSGFSPTSGLAWSPDGGTVAVAVGGMQGFLMRDAGAWLRLMLVDAATGDMRPATDQIWGKITGIDWLADGSLIVTGTELATPNSQIWLVGSDGQVQRLTRDLNSYEGISVARDTGVVVTTLGDISSTLSLLAPDGASLVPVTRGTGRSDGRSGLTWTHDGRLIYSSAASGGRVDLWVSNADGSGARQLTSDDTVEIGPAVSPDDAYLVYQAGARGGLARLSLDGGRPVQLTTEATDHAPVVLPDGVVQYLHLPSTPTDDGVVVDVRRISIEGGEMSAVATVDAFSGDLTPDGRYLVGFHHFTIGFVPTDGSPTELRFPIYRLPIGLSLNPTADVLTFLQSEPPPPSLWNQPLDGGKPALLYQSEGDRIFNFAWSPDGVLAIAHGPALTDIVMISGVR